MEMFPSKKELKAKQEFPGSAGKAKKMPKEKAVAPRQEFEGSAGKGGLPNSNC